MKSAVGTALISSGTVNFKATLKTDLHMSSEINKYTALDVDASLLVPMQQEEKLQQK